MPNTDITHLAVGDLQPDGVGEPEVGMADHTEDALHPPVDQGLGDDIRYRPLVRRFGLKPDKDFLAAQFNRVRPLAGVFMSARRGAGQRIEIPAVPGTPDPAFSLDANLDRAFAERPALVWAVIVHRGPLSVEMYRQIDVVRAVTVFTRPSGRSPTSATLIQSSDPSRVLVSLMSASGPWLRWANLVGHPTIRLGGTGHDVSLAVCLTMFVSLAGKEGSTRCRVLCSIRKQFRLQTAFRASIFPGPASFGASILRSYG